MTGRVIEWWTVILQFANGVRKDIWKWLWELYPAETIKAFKQQIETASANQRGLVGQSWAWILNILLGTNFLGEEKNKTKTDEAKKQAEKDKKAKEEGKQEWDKWKTSWKLPTFNEMMYKLWYGVWSIPRKTAEAWHNIWHWIRDGITWNNDWPIETKNSTEKSSNPKEEKWIIRKWGEIVWKVLRWTAKAWYNALRWAKDGIVWSNDK